jgi:hypothetical protein
MNIQKSETYIHKSETYRLHLTGGLQLLLTRSENRESLDIEIEWANGETMECLSEWNIAREDLRGISDLFAKMAQAVKA